MKKEKIIYWITTVFVSSMMLYSAFSYLVMEEMRNEFERLGFPDYFRVQLGIAKALGAIVLLLPVIPNRLKEFAYMGFAIAYISAFIAHLSTGDPVSPAVKALTLLGILFISFIYLHRTGKVQGV